MERYARRAIDSPARRAYAIVSPDPSGLDDAGDREIVAQVYERLGDDVANEIVEWFNQVDAAYRYEFRELFEVHFARFDAKLEQRIAELRAELEIKLGRLETRLIRWMFLFWIGTIGTLIALQKL